MLYCDHQNDFCSGLRGEILSSSEFPSDGTSYALCQPHTNLAMDQKKQKKKKKGVRVGRR